MLSVGHQPRGSYHRAVAWVLGRDTAVLELKVLRQTWLSGVGSRWARQSSMRAPHSAPDLDVSLRPGEVHQCGLSAIAIDVEGADRLSGERWVAGDEVQHHTPS